MHSRFASRQHTLDPRVTQQSHDINGGDDHGGAARIWSSDDPHHLRWREHVDAGDFRGAEAMTHDAAFPLAVEARDLLARLRYEWALDADAVLAKLREALGCEVTREQLDGWTVSGAIESRMIDGERRWFRREPRNLILFDRALAEQARRARPQAADRHGELSPIVPHVIDVMRAADLNPGAREVLPVRTRFDYSIVVKPDRPGAAKGSTVRAWLPFPQVYGAQRDVLLIDSFPKRERVSPKGSPHRTIYFEQKVRDPSKAVRFEASFEYTTSAIMSSGGRVADPSRSERPIHTFLAERPPHVVFTDQVKAVVAECSTGSPDQVTLAKRLWNWVDDHIPWRAEHEYGLIPSIPVQALAVRRGDCGVQALTFISLCRCAGIPARWQSGFTTDPATGGNLHDWAEVWLEALGGWVPADPSYGKKKHDDPRVRDFFFGNMDRYRLIVNLDYGRDLTPAKAALRSEPLDFQRGEVEIDGRNLYFDEWDYTFRFEHREG